MITVFASAANSIIDEYGVANRNSYWTVRSGITTEMSQSFNCKNEAYLTKVNFYLCKQGSPTGNVYAYLYSHSGTYGTSSVPNTLLATSTTTLDISTLQAYSTFELKEFNFNYKLTAGTNYVIVLKYAGGSSGNNLCVGYDSSTPTHAGNLAYKIAGWTADNTSDLVFKCEYKDLDITQYIDWGSFKVKDALADKVNTCDFSIRNPVGKGISLILGQTINISDGATDIFAGSVLKTSRSMANFMEVIDVSCVDYTRDLDKYLVTERYEGKTVEYIISDILDNYGVGFTHVNTSCGTILESITFNYIPVSQCLQKLAKAVNYFWYVDYDKDIHFFARAENAAPFSLSDTSGNYIYNSLKLNDDLSQLKTRVQIRGGETIADTKTEYLSGDGTNLYFKLANKFSALPTVKVGGTTKTVGVDRLSVEADFDCFWDFNEKYIRFKASTIPSSGTNNIEVSGTPLVPIISQVEDDVAVATYGVWEFYKEDKTIKTKEEAKQYAIAQLEEYKNSIVEGTFETTTSGLKSGQIITIASTLRSLTSTQYVIQEVVLKMKTPTTYKYSVKLATYRSWGIIDFLQQLINDGRVESEQTENEVLYKYYKNCDSFQYPIAYRPWPPYLYPCLTRNSLYFGR